MLKRNLAILALAVALVGGGAVAWAQTGDGSSTPPTTTAAQPAAQQGGAGKGAQRPAAILRRVIHGDLIVRGKNGFQNVTYDRGTEDGVSNGTLTITRPDNKKVDVNLTDSTKYRGVQSASQLQAGKQTLVVSQNGNALIVGQRAANNGSAPTGQTQPS